VFQADVSIGADLPLRGGRKWVESGNVEMEGTALGSVDIFNATR
jgi:hypothetical protein